MAKGRLGVGQRLADHEPIAVAFDRRAQRGLVAVNPAAALVAVIGGAPEIELLGRPRARFLVGRQRPGERRAQHHLAALCRPRAVATDRDLVGETGCAARHARDADREPGPDARHQHEDRDRADEDQRRHPRGGGEERSADDASRAEDAPDADLLARRLRRVLDEIVLLHLAAEVKQAERPDRDDDIDRKRRDEQEVVRDRRGDQDEQER